MGDLKPLGSEKLGENEKLKRILELTYYNKPKKTSDNKPETVKESASGVFGIVREKDGYYVKKGLNENTLDYIGGLFMKNKNKFSSYGEALKRMSLLVGQENIQEATKYVLKQNTPKQETPMPAPTMDEVPPIDAPVDSSSTDIPPTDGSTEPTDGSTEPTDVSPEGGESNKRSDYMGEVQKYAGKLGQQLRDEHERMESDDIKYVLNMIISAVDLDKLDDEDIDEIGKKFDRDEEEGGLPSDDSNGDVPADDEVPDEEPSNSDSELGETMSKLSKFVNSPAVSQDEIDLSKYADLGSVDETKELDMDEIKNEINSRISETLSKYFK